MKLKIEEKTFKEIEIELPHYTTNGIHFFKFDDNENCTSIYKSNSNEFEISKRTRKMTPDSWWLYPQTTEEKFNEVLKIIQDEIN